MIKKIEEETSEIFDFIKLSNELKKDLKNYKQLKIYLTGYGPFMSITENPSQLLVDSISKIKDKITEKFENKITFEVIQIMDVDCDFVEAAVKKMHETIFSDQDIYTMKLVINVGVNE